eukprot:12384332-Alexandrium_andersonii.AAC.1
MAGAPSATGGNAPREVTGRSTPRGASGSPATREKASKNSGIRPGPTLGAGCPQQRLRTEL